MGTAFPLACFLSLIRLPFIKYEDAVLQLLPVEKAKCPFVRSVTDVNFMLYTNQNPTESYDLIIGDDKRLAASPIDFNAQTVLYFPAWMEDYNDGSSLLVREAYVFRGGYNYILVDARSLEAGPWYPKAADNTWYIGRFAGYFIDYLVKRGLDLSRTHLVGHSLGAQIAGVAGGSLQSGRVSRITGLDPAWPLFDKRPLSQRLDPSDAEFVDVIHTDSGVFGFPTPVGHADFYPNGGISPQPGCELKVVVPQQNVLSDVFCSHWRSYRFFAESVLRPNAFRATSCASWKKYKQGACNRTRETSMGLGVDHNARGIFYLKTNADAPFSLE